MSTRCTEGVSPEGLVCICLECNISGLGYNSHSAVAAFLGGGVKVGCYVARSAYERVYGRYRKDTVSKASECTLQAVPLL